MSQGTSDPKLLFGKRCTIQVGDLLIEAGQGTGLDVLFTVKRSIKVTAQARTPQPNTANLTIYNLSPSHRRALETSTVLDAGVKAVPTVISAGYQGRQSVLFSGELRTAHSVPDGPRIATELTSGDGDQALQQARLTIALGKGSTAAQALKMILLGLGVGAGNLQKGIALLQTQPLAARLFSKGVVFKGGASEIMSDFCRSAGLEWSVQNSALQITALGQPMQGQAILIDSNHGMIGSPTVDTKGLLSVKTEMIPDVVPGVALSLASANIQGGFRVTSVTTKGDTNGPDWGHDIEAMRY